MTKPRRWSEIIVLILETIFKKKKKNFPTKESSRSSVTWKIQKERTWCFVSIFLSRIIGISSPWIQEIISEKWISKAECATVCAHGWLVWWQTQTSPRCVVYVHVRRHPNTKTEPPPLQYGNEQNEELTISHRGRRLTESAQWYIATLLSPLGSASGARKPQRIEGCYHPRYGKVSGCL